MNTTPHRILVVDDDPAIRDLLVDLLSAEGYETHQASGGWDMICAMARVRPNLILLDVVMAEMDGLEACRVIKRRTQRFRDVRVVLMSAAYATEATKRVICHENGADDFLCKPGDMGRLIGRVAELLTAQAA